MSKSDNKLPKTMRAMIRASATDFVNCRDMMHAWEPYTAERTTSGFKRVLVCRRCDAHRFDELDKRGGVIRRHYTYAVGYVAKGIGRMTGDTKNMVRLESLTRMLKGEGKE